MSDRYRTAYRGYLIDHHSPDPPVITLDRLDPKEYETFFREANISSLMLYCKDHWGNSYYNTKVGKKHPGLGDRDWIRELREVLRRCNIEFNAYYCLEYDTYAPVAHPEWAIQKADGTPLTCSSPIAHWRMPCYETEYRQYALGQLREIAENYDPDSLFLDIFGKSLCYCPTCRKMFEDRYGYPLPETEEGIMAHYREVTEFLDDRGKAMLQDITDVMKGVNPEIKITINFAALYCKEIRDMLDYQFTEPFAGNWLSAAYARDTAIGQYPQLGPGNVSQVYNYNPESIYILAASEIAAQGCRVFMYSGSQHPDGTLEHTEAQRIGAAYREVEKFEQYLGDREVVADVAIIQSDTSVPIGNDKPLPANAIGRAHQGSVHRDAIVGAMKLCDSSKYSWKVLPEQLADLQTLLKFRTVVLPDVFCILPQLADALTEYVRQGGNLILSGQTGLFDRDGNRLSDFALADVMGVQYIDQITRFEKASWGGYLSPSDDPLLADISNTFAPVSSVYFRVRPTTARALNELVYPAVELTDKTWVNWWNPPPKVKTNDPGITLNQFGAGKVFYAAFQMMRMQNEKFNYLQGLFTRVLKDFVAQPRVYLQTDHQNTIGYVAYDRPDKDELIVHEVSHTAQYLGGDTPVVEGGTLRIQKGAYQVVSAEMVYPQQSPLQVSEQQDFYEIQLPPLTIHQMVRVAYKS